MNCQQICKMSCKNRSENIPKSTFSVLCDLNLLESRGNHSARSNTMKLVYTGRRWVGCYIWYSEEGTGLCPSPPRPLLAVPNATAHPPTAIVVTLAFFLRV